jgi:arylsulfatase A-like enzyme
MFRAGDKTNPAAARTFGKLPAPNQRKHNDQWELFFNPDGKKDERNQVMFKLWHDKNYRHSRDLTPEQVQKVVDDYDSSIAYIDAEVGKLLSCLKAKNIYDDSVIMIMADHGEALYEHKEWFHGNNVYDETSRVPMIVKFPKKMGLQGRVERVVQLLDLFPTLADACGLRLPLEGRSLLESAVNPALDDTMVISRTGHKIPVYGVRWQNWYYMYNMETFTEQLFALRGDRRQDVHAEHAELCRMLFLRLMDRVKSYRNSGAEKEIDTSKLPQKEIENLKALGYL